MSTPTLSAPETDEWDVASLDLDAYLYRIGHPRVPPSADALRPMHEAHVRAIPFENVDVVLGTHRGLGLDVIGDKLVRRHRGGYCYEHALLFAAVLEQLGYPVQRWIARVQPHRAGPRTHMMLAVPADGVDYDVAHHYTSTQMSSTRWPTAAGDGNDVVQPWQDSPVLLRREHPRDQSAARAVHNAAFGGGADTAEAQLVDDLRADGDVIAALSIVAVVDGDVVGHVICSRASITDRPSIGLGPLAVIPAGQRRGVGQALMHAVLAAADALDAPAVALLGDPGYYSRFGFVAAATLGVLPPVPEWAGHFQVRPLNSWDDSLRGIFRYAPAFDRLL